MESPLAKAVIAGHITVPALLVPPSLALTKVAPAGTTSLATTFEGVDGPLLVTVWVRLRFCPATTLAEPVFTTFTSAEGVTLVMTCWGGLCVSVELMAGAGTLDTW